MQLENEKEKRYDKEFLDIEGFAFQRRVMMMVILWMCSTSSEIVNTRNRRDDIGKKEEKG